MYLHFTCLFCCWVLQFLKLKARGIVETACCGMDFPTNKQEKLKHIRLVEHNSSPLVSSCSDLCKGPAWDQQNQKPDVSRESAVSFVLLQKRVLWAPRVQSKTEIQIFCIVHFLAQDTGFLFLRSTLFPPNYKHQFP